MDVRARVVAGVLGGALGLVGALVACGSGASVEADSRTAGCAKDTDCKGDRVCVDRQCKDRPGPTTGSAAQQPSAVASPPAASAPPPPPAPPPPAPSGAPPLPGLSGPGVRELPPVEWTPLLGPKMPAGSEVVHMVYEGPFGPGPRSIFAITRRGGDRLFAILLADGKAWPAGPLAEEETYHHGEVMAVAFFDADGDATTDALVVARYAVQRAPDPQYRNALLRWTDQGLRRLLKLEEGIRDLASVEAVRKKLGR
ncbi:MAG: hypothetical protein HY908_31915 [Myxococcales bacterium]|nr:hypothetical protein [Myxococcales bacterium]